MSVFLLFLYIIYVCSHLYYFPVCIWAVHFLSVSEAVQERLYHELVEVLGEEPVTLEKIPQLRWATVIASDMILIILSILYSHLLIYKMLNQVTPMWKRFNHEEINSTSSIVVTCESSKKELFWSRDMGLQYGRFFIIMYMLLGFSFLWTFCAPEGICMAILWFQ